ncbi:MAG: hypothetical protein RLZZ621_2029, partial [Gemmatimonadota bacterium]
MNLPAITINEIRAARERIGSLFDPSPARHYPQLDALVGHDVRVVIKHENHLPTGSFKVRNGAASITA